MRHTFAALTSGLAAFAFGAVSMAQSLTAQDVDRVLAVLQGLEEISERYDGTLFEVPSAIAGPPRGFTPGSMGSPMSAPPAAPLPIGDDGGLAVFARSIAALPSGSIRGDVMSLVKQNGFGSLDGFASVADDMMTAWLAYKLEDVDMSDMAIEPAQLQMMPAEYRGMIEAQLAQTRKLVEAAKSAPPADVEVVKSRAAAIEASFER